MEMVSSTHSIEALCSLLNNPIEEEHIYYNDPTSSAQVSGPGDIVPGKQANLTVSSKSDKKNVKEIWDETEVAEETNDMFDPRLQPKYEIIFKQKVRSEDVFLGFSRKDPSTSCCEDMVVRIELPGTNASDVSLQVKNKSLDLCTPKYKLGLHLPHPVDQENGQARFISDTETLEVTLTMIREYDFINFF